MTCYGSRIAVYAVSLEAIWDYWLCLESWICKGVDTFQKMNRALHVLIGYVYIYIYTHTHAHVHMQLRTYRSTYTYVYIYIYIHIYIYTYIYIYMCVGVWVCVCVCVCALLHRVGKERTLKRSPPSMQQKGAASNDWCSAVQIPGWIGLRRLYGSLVLFGRPL